MPRTATTRKQQVLADFRRADILVAATKVFAQKGFEATRMEDIANAAEIGKGTLYRYFPSKDTVYEATVLLALSKVAALTEEHVNRASGLASKLAAFISVRIAFWDEQQQFYRIILSITRQEQHRKRSLGWQKETVLYLESMFADAAEAGEIPQQDFLSAAWTTLDAIRGVNERRAFSAGRSIEEDAKFLTGFLWNALHGHHGNAR